MRQRAAIVLALLAALFPALGSVGPAAAAGFTNAAGAAGAGSPKAPLPVLAARAYDGVVQPLTWSSQVAASRTTPACDDATDVDPAATAPAPEVTSQLRGSAVVPQGWHSIDRAGRNPGSRGPPCSARF